LPADTESRVRSQRILALGRRGKYLLLELERGAILIHLGMSGSLRVVSLDAPIGQAPLEAWVKPSDQALILSDDTTRLTPTALGKRGSPSDNNHQQSLQEVNTVCDNMLSLSAPQGASGSCRLG
jgi:formamidopyrimidine-DNA glycosylase